jgi:hypothetical protein
LPQKIKARSFSLAGAASIGPSYWNGQPMENMMR